MTQSSSVLSNGVKLVSEVVVSPGTSLVLDGRIAEGVSHMAGGLLSRALLGSVLGPIGLVGLALNSYAKSTTGVGILGQFSGRAKAASPATDTAEEA